MGPGIPEPDNSRPNPSFFNTRQTWTRVFKFREFPYLPEPDFFRTRPITSQHLDFMMVVLIFLYLFRDRMHYLSWQKKLEWTLIGQKCKLFYIEFDTQVFIFFSWKYRCLEGKGWNLEEAKSAFLVAKQEGKIPPEAFT